MASSTRGGAALQNKVTLLNQQLVYAQQLTAAKNGELVAKDAMIAAKNSELVAKDGELAAKDGELAALRIALEQAQQLAVSGTRQADVTEGGAGEHAKKRARVADSSSSPLDDDEILDTVFSYVGIGDYIYTGAVSRRWKGRYTKLCYNKAKEGQKHKLTTAHHSTVMTPARLQLALKSSLSVAGLQCNIFFHSYVVRYSLDPIAVLALLKTRDFQWRPHLAKLSAQYSTLELLQWLHECGCPWDEQEVCRGAARKGNVDTLIWLQEVTAPWSAALRSEMLFDAGWENRLATVKWLRQQGADWPSSFFDTAAVGGHERKVCWTVRVVT
jgi:hypothetical protein